MTALVLLLAAIAGATQRLTMPAPSLHQASRDVRVYLPPSYFRPEAADRRYPVVYLLHGWPGGAGNWFGSGRAAQTADEMIGGRLIPELILICPDGSRGLLGRSLYINSYDGSSRMADFIVHDVVDWADSTFRTRPGPGGRALVGLSDGGSAAVNLTFQHPDVFGACGSLSGEFRLEKEAGMGGAIGPEPGATRLLEENSPALYASRMAARLRGLVIYFDCGVSDDPIGDNRDFHALLLRLGVPHTYREFPGSHSWGYWRTHLRDALVTVTSRMSRPPRPGPDGGSAP
jgi:enterochelin esterase-like enzyme